MPPAIATFPPAKTLLRWILHTYWRFSRGMTLGVRGIILDGQNRVCLIRHTYIAGWHLPGGGVETGETALESLGRELAEEACVALSGPPILHGIFLNRKISRRDHIVVYIVRNFVINNVKKPDREIAEAGFFALDALPEGTTGAVRRRLDEIALGMRPAEVW